MFLGEDVTANFKILRGRGLVVLVFSHGGLSEIIFSNFLIFSKLFFLIQKLSNFFWGDHHRN